MRHRCMEWNTKWLYQVAYLSSRSVVQLGRFFFSRYFALCWSSSRWGLHTLAPALSRTGPAKKISTLERASRIPRLGRRHGARRRRPRAPRPPPARGVALARSTASQQAGSRSRASSAVTRSFVCMLSAPNRVQCFVYYSVVVVVARLNSLCSVTSEITY